jgi:hypothetical protein
MCLIDSDFDSEDEEFGDDIEEIITHPRTTNFHIDSDNDRTSSSSDEIRAVENLPDFGSQFMRTRCGPQDVKLLRSAREFRDKKRRALAQSIID